MTVTYSAYKNFFFRINFINALFVIDALDPFSSRKHSKYLPVEYCLNLFSFIVMLKAGYCLVSFLKKASLVLSYPKCIDSSLSINHSQSIPKTAIRCFLVKITFFLLKRIKKIIEVQFQSHNRLQLISYNLCTIKKVQGPKCTLEGSPQFKATDSERLLQIRFHFFK